MHICTIIIVINLCAIITVMYNYANNLPYKQMWSHQAKAMTWVYLKIPPMLHFFSQIGSIRGKVPKYDKI